MSEYDQRADEFLGKHNLEVVATYKNTGAYFEDDKERGESRDIYQIEIRRKDNGQNITFGFGQSIVETETGETPTAYDVLASLSSDITCPDNFAEFCGEYGYNEDSRKAEGIFEKVSDFAERLNNFFSEGEKEDLAEIQ